MKNPTMPPRGFPNLRLQDFRPPHRSRLPSEEATPELPRSPTQAATYEILVPLRTNAGLEGSHPREPRPSSGKNERGPRSRHSDCQEAVADEPESWTAEKIKAQ